MRNQKTIGQECAEAIYLADCDKNVENVGRIIDNVIASRSPWVKASERPPTREEAYTGSAFGLVLVADGHGRNVVDYKEVDGWQYWMPIPPLPSEER